MSKQPHDYTHLRTLQQQFTENIRHPEKNLYPDNTDPQRMKIYQELMYGAIEELFSRSFPVINRLLTDQQREEILRKFMQDHHAQSPLFHEVPVEFINLFNNTYANPELPFLTELAHYEWLELMVELSCESTELLSYNPNGNFITEIPVPSPFIQLACYQWPVHKIGANFIPTETSGEPTFLVVYRNMDDDVEFLEINQITARLIELMIDNGDLSGEGLLLTIASELNHPAPKQIVDAGQSILNQLHELQIVLGTKEIVK